MSLTKVTAYSYSRLSLYEQCPLKFKLQNIDKIPQPQVPAMARGNEIHQEAAKFLEGKLPELPKSCETFAGMFFELRELRPLVEDKWGFDRNWKEVGWFDPRGGPVKVHKRIIVDAAVLYPDGELDVIDHKTGKRYSDNDDQMELFAAAGFYRYKGKVNKVTTRLWYLDSGEEVVKEFSGEDCKRFAIEYDERAEPMFNDTTFAPRPNDKCRWCHYSRSSTGHCKYG